MSKPSNPNDPSEKDGKGVSRRQLLTFWRRPLEELAKPPPEPLKPPKPRPAPLRPPGTLHEFMLVNHCTHCGKCVEACPADAIFPLAAEYGVAAGTPAIDARKQPCVVCSGLKCTHVCPSGALLPLTSEREITMGTARLDSATCLTWLGQECTACLGSCPIPQTLTLDDAGHLQIDAGRCIGCGLCERICPTEPQSIRVIPRA
jgi:ferredoxin-type protein NapG